MDNQYIMLHYWIRVGNLESTCTHSMVFLVIWMGTWLWRTHWILLINYVEVDSPSSFMYVEIYLFIGEVTFSHLITLFLNSHFVKMDFHMCGGDGFLEV